jgi:hypothetical protein
MAEHSSSISSSSVTDNMPSEYEQLRLTNVRKNREFYSENGFGDPYPGFNLDPSKLKDSLKASDLFIVKKTPLRVGKSEKNSKRKTDGERSSFNHRY